MRNVLLVALGSTARADCLAEVIANSRDAALHAYLAHPNPSVIARAKSHLLGKFDDFLELKKYATSVPADLAFVSPEAPLAAGVADALEEIGVPCAGPLQSLARLESSKSFTRNLLSKHGIEGSPTHRVFDSIDGIDDYLLELGKFVIKPDGLTGGKGVKVLGDHLKGVEDALEYCGEILDSGSRVVVEEKMEGEEFSVQFFTDGKTVVPAPVVQDHKRAFEGDQGPNTGGMGSYSAPNRLLPFLSPSDLRDAQHMTEQVVEAAFKETGRRFKGILYGGFMLTSEGVKLVEYNVRFGDPEVMNVLPLLKTDFVDVLEAIVQGKLGQTRLEFLSKASVCKYAVAQGYPTEAKKGGIIDLKELRAFQSKHAENVRVYLGSVEAIPGETDKYKMGASRAVGCVGIGATIEEAERYAEQAVSLIKGSVYHRKDIGTKALVDKRVEHMRQLRKK